MLSRSRHSLRVHISSGVSWRVFSGNLNYPRQAPSQAYPNPEHTNQSMQRERDCGTLVAGFVTVHSPTGAGKTADTHR
jgi:hypothetical protein